MKWFRNMKIRRKLLVVLTLMMSITVGIGVLGIYNIKKIGELTESKSQLAQNTQILDQTLWMMGIMTVVGVLISIALVILLSNALVKPLKKLIEAAEQIGQGQLAIDMGDQPKDETGELAQHFQTVIAHLQELANDAQFLTKAAVEGRLATRADVTKHSGVYAQIVGGVNQTLDAVIVPLNVAAHYVDRISTGDIPPKITDTYYGDFNEIKTNLNICIDTVNRLVADANMLTKAAVEGRLATRADATKHSGKFAEIVQGVNDTLDAVIKPLNVAADYVERISKGDIPAKITDTYYGDFNEIKTNLNICIDTVNRLVVDANMLTKAAIEGKLDTRADATIHRGDFAKIVEGVNKTLDAVIEPVQEAAAVLQEMANGNLQPRVTGKYKGDHAAIKDALNNTLDTIASYVTEISQILNEMANANMVVSINKDYKGDFSKIKHSLNLIIASLNEVLSGVNGSADEVASASKQVAVSSQSLADGATEQALAIENLTQSIGKIAAQTTKSAQSALEVNRIAEQTKSHAVSGNGEMKHLLSAMEQINDTSRNISRIIETIDDIAAQTNLLSLNAAIEAARAGQQGNGFNVVAREIRDLANKSAEAAKETATLIEDSINKVKQGTQIAHTTAGTLDEIVIGVDKVSGLVSNIAVASQEQEGAVEVVNKNIKQISGVVQANAATAQESAAASEELLSQAEVLKLQTNRFKLRKTT
ncbi:MAG: methyl-accepting chemotaxis protein [Cellulosilyticaceae bacterium]